MLNLLEHILPGILAGSRCRICGASTSPSRNQKDKICGAHSASDERWLCDFAENLQLDFWFFCMLLRDTPLPVLSWLSESEQMRFDAYNLTKNMCMISQVVQAPDLLREHQNSPNSPILNMEEVNVSIPSPIGYKHSAFLITLRSGVQYVFDPTGPQFGADWPLLERWTRYRDRTFGMVVIRPLGSRRDDWAKGIYED